MRISGSFLAAVFAILLAVSTTTARPFPPHSYMPPSAWPHIHLPPHHPLVSAPAPSFGNEFPPHISEVPASSPEVAVAPPSTGNGVHEVPASSPAVPAAPSSSGNGLPPHISEVPASSSAPSTHSNGVPSSSNEVPPSISEVPVSSPVATPSSFSNGVPPQISEVPASSPAPSTSTHSNGVPTPEVASVVPAASPPPSSGNSVPSNPAPAPEDEGTKCTNAMNDNGGMASCRYHHNQNYDAQKCCNYLSTLVDSCSYVPYLQSQPFRDILRRVCDQASGPSPSS